MGRRLGQLRLTLRAPDKIYQIQSMFDRVCVGCSVEIWFGQSLSMQI